MQKFIITAALLLLTACSTQPPRPVTVNYMPAAITNLDVQSIGVTDRSGMQPADSPYNAHHFQPTIAEAIRQWTTDKLQAVGAPGSGQAIIIIKDATLTMQAIPHKDDWMTRAQTAKYTARAEVEIDVQGTNKYASASAEAMRFVTLPENPTEAERQNAYTELLNGLMRDLGQNVETAIQDHLQSFIITAPILR